MARTRAQSTAHQGHTLPESTRQGSEPGHVGKSNSRRRASRQRSRYLQEQEALHQQHPPPTKRLPPLEAFTPESRGVKRQVDALAHDPDAVLKRPRLHHTDSTVDETSGQVDPVAAWARDGQWPRDYLEPRMENILARRRSLSPRKRSNSATSTTPSDQRPREEKSAPYRDARYTLLLQTKGSYMGKSTLGITDESKRLCQALLAGEQPLPSSSLFDDGIFENVCENIENKNEARVIQDISRLIVPSAETLALRSKELGHLAEAVNEGWNNSLPLTGSRPQPDYSVGFRREAFTDGQLTKLSPCIGDIVAGDQSIFMATYYMYFPFLTCEVKCGAAALDTADRQNAHSMTLAVRAVVELFRAVERQSEIDRHILAFSISHDHRSVRIYGHYAVIDGRDTKYYRHPIRTFDFTELDGKDKWTAYRFTRNVYHLWAPAQLKRICSAIDQLPEPDFDVGSQPEKALSQDPASLKWSGGGSSSSCGGQDGQPGNAAQVGTPGTSSTEPQVAKKRRGTKN